MRAQLLGVSDLLRPHIARYAVDSFPAGASPLVLCKELSWAMTSNSYEGMVRAKILASIENFRFSISCRYALLGGFCRSRITAIRESGQKSRASGATSPSR